MGMFIANEIAHIKGMLPKKELLRMEPLLRQNFKSFKSEPIPLIPFIEALKKDKKNIDSHLKLVLPIGENASIEIVELAPNQEFVNHCDSILMKLKK
jgi:3-dehydroquinate synthetase